MASRLSPSLPPQKPIARLRMPQRILDVPPGAGEWGVFERMLTTVFFLSSGNSMFTWLRSRWWTATMLCSSGGFNRCWRSRPTLYDSKSWIARVSLEFIWLSYFIAFRGGVSFDWSNSRGQWLVFVLTLLTSAPEKPELRTRTLYRLSTWCFWKSSSSLRERNQRGFGSLFPGSGQEGTTADWAESSVGRGTK